MTHTHEFKLTRDFTGKVLYTAPRVCRCGATEAMHPGLRLPGDPLRSGATEASP